MGLDMYLSKAKYIGANYEHRNVTLKITCKIGDEEVKINTDRVSEIIEEVGYWRKANAIHNFFVQRVQEGVDDCGRYYVSIENLKDLKERCEKVLASSKTVKAEIENGMVSGPDGVKPNMEEGLILEDTSVAEELLPSTSGPFFGNTGYNNFYLEDLQRTIKIIDHALKEYDKRVDSFYYRSSW